MRFRYREREGEKLTAEAAGASIITEASLM
jgi:hypothetical protein